MKNQSFFLQNRLDRIQNFLGLNEENKTVPPLKFTEKIQELATKWPKDIQTKYEKVKKITNAYNRVLEETISSNKIEVLQEEQDELAEIAAELEQIEQLSSAMNFQPLLGMHSRTKDIQLLNTASKLGLQGPSESLKLLQYSEQELSGLNQTRREQFTQVVELYNQMVGNLNFRLQQLFNRIVALQTA